MNITQCRMGRAALNWSAKDLAAASGIAGITIARFEGGKTISAESLAALQSAMEAKGVRFEKKAARLVVSVAE